MADNFNTNTKNNGEWLTPKYITDFFDFDLDPCSPIEKPWATAKKHFNINDDGLTQPWNGFVFCNPPYGRETYTWMKKCHEHDNCIGLTFARTETKGFHSEVWEKASAIFFFKGRLAFHYVTGERGNVANAPSVLIAYGLNAVEELYRFSKENNGRLVILDETKKIKFR